MPSLLKMAEPVAALLKQRGQTVAVSNSAAGGLVSAALLSVPGASGYYLGGASVYTQTARRGLLRFNDAEAQQRRGSTEEYATLTATTMRNLLDADWAIGVSGAAGPSGNRYGDPAGHVALAVVGPVTATRIVQTGNDEREDNMWAFAQAALDLLYDTVKAN